MTLVKMSGSGNKSDALSCRMKTTGNRLHTGYLFDYIHRCLFIPPTDWLLGNAAIIGEGAGVSKSLKGRSYRLDS